VPQPTEPPASAPPPGLVDLDPDQPAASATVAILGALFEIVRAHEEGVRRADDPEPLHDFRVAVRRARSALGQLRDVLPAAPGKRLRRELSWLAGATGPSRDLDVFMEKLPAYLASLPAHLAADAGAVGERLAQLRARARRLLAAELDSGRYRRLVRAWPRTLAAAAEPGLAAGRLPIAEVAADRIARARGRVLALAAGSGPSAPAADLHKLRIACKKLRYLSEFFRSLHDEAETARKIEALKVLQDVLGDLNDLSFQRSTLHRLAGRSRPARAAVAALDELLAGLERERRQALAPLLRSAATSL